MRSAHELFQRAAQGLFARAGHKIRSDRRGVRLAGPRRSPFDRRARRGLATFPRHGCGKEPALRLPARRQYFARRRESRWAGCLRRAQRFRASYKIRRKSSFGKIFKRSAPRPSVVCQPQRRVSACQNSPGETPFEDAMEFLASLRPPVDAFFDQVTVNAERSAVAAQPPAALERIAKHDAWRRRFFEGCWIGEFPSREIMAERAVQPAPPNQAPGHKFDR